MNHYTILGLSSSPSKTLSYTQSDIKSAYRKALLLHHPDKTPTSPPQTSPPSQPAYTIDQIALAFTTLSTPALKLKFDQSLRTGHQPQDRLSKDLPGLETVDLDDMLFDEDQSVWYRGCRCGRERAFVVTEMELEREERWGEVLVGCEGCSLWLRVEFGVESG